MSHSAGTVTLSSNTCFPDDGSMAEVIRIISCSPSSSSGGRMLISMDLFFSSRSEICDLKAFT